MNGSNPYYEAHNDSPENEEHPRFWLSQGGGGFEGGLEALRAATFTGEGLVQVLCAYRDYLRQVEALRGAVVTTEARLTLELARTCLHRWAARYAGSHHALKHAKETNLIIERIDDWLLRN